MSKSIGFAAAVMTALLVSACANSPPMPPGPVDKASPIFDHGYRDGCATVNPRFRKEAGYESAVRDEKMYAEDSNYHAGYDSGIRNCADKVNQGGLPIPGNAVIL